MKYVLLTSAFVLGTVLYAHQSAERPAASRPQIDESAPAGPRYTPGSELIRPSDFREWMFVTSGLGMTYNQPTGAARTPNFTNVYVNPSSYRAFMKTGQWPDKTMFILEIRASTSEGSINKGGHFQSNLVVVEASVKDEARFPGKWAYFDFGRDMKPQVAALPRTERCYACHTDNGAVDNTFVQFYPTLLEVATKMGTVKPVTSAPSAH
jgi:Cytochrome P460